jgi:polar amino acid transport system permease protein
MDEFIDNFANIDTLIEVWPLLLSGLKITAILCLVTVPLGAALGLAVAVLHSLRIRFLTGLLTLYVDLLRSFPPLVLLILIYYGLPFLGLELGELPAASLALVLNSSSYYGEIFRAGIEAIPLGQREAARSTGLTALQAMAYVVLPQAIKAVVPPLTSNTLELIKLTSIASVVALPELLRTARMAQDLVYNPTPLMAAALIYFLLLWPLVRLISKLDKRSMAMR